MPAFLADQNSIRAQPQTGSPGGVASENKSKLETLFGPALGAVQPAPDWTNVKTSAKEVADELTPEIVRSWIAKSKDVCNIAYDHRSAC